MKIKDCFISYESDGDNVIVDTSASFSGIIHINSSAAFIVECLRTNTTEAEILEKMKNKYDATDAELSAGIADVLGKLRSIKALEE